MNIICCIYRLRFKMAVIFRIAFVVLMLVCAIEGMGICFGGGYPKCCQNGKNNCGPFCASCSRVVEFLKHMNMFDMMGFSMGTPGVFRIINPAGHAHTGAAVPTNFNRRPKSGRWSTMKWFWESEIWDTSLNFRSVCSWQNQWKLYKLCNNELKGINILFIYLEHYLYMKNYY